LPLQKATKTGSFGLGYLFSQEFHDDIDDDGYQNAEQNAGHEREVDGKVFALYMDVARQVAEPGDFLREKEKKPNGEDNPSKNKKH